MNELIPSNPSTNQPINRPRTHASKFYIIRLSITDGSRATAFHSALGFAATYPSCPFLFRFPFLVSFDFVSFRFVSLGHSSSPPSSLVCRVRRPVHVRLPSLSIVFAFRSSCIASPWFVLTCLPFSYPCVSPSTQSTSSTPPSTHQHFDPSTHRHLVACNS